MKKRIGNDFSVSWVITRLGEPESFEPDMPIKVLVTSMTYSWIKIEPVFHVIGNIISFDVPADKQQSGRYRIMLQYQKRGMPQNRTYTVDACNVFELVADSCAEDITEGDVSIASEVRIVQDGKDGLNAYQLAILLEGFDGTAEEYISSIRKPSLDAAGEAITATRDLRLLETAVTRQEELRGTEEALRQTAESTRATTESGRVSTVNPNKIAQFVGQKWFNTVSKSWFIGNSTISMADWVTLSGAKATAYRITTDDSDVVQGIEALFGMEPRAMSLNENVYTVQDIPEGCLIGCGFDGVNWVKQKEETI